MRISLTLSRYLSRQFLLWFLTFFGGLAVVILIADFLELLRRSANKTDAGVGIVFQMALLKLPHTVQDLLPFAVLFGGIMAFWRLTRSQELVVARAVGISVWQFMLPSVMMALLIGCLKIGLFNPIAATTFGKYEAMESRIIRGQVEQTLFSATGLWLRQTTGEGHAIIHASSVSPNLTRLHTVLVLLYDPENRFVGRLDAGIADLKPGKWVLENAWHAKTGQPSRAIGTFELPTDFTVERIQESFSRPETMSFWSLPAFIELLEHAGFSALRHRLYLQALLASPLLLAAMVLIAATFSLRPARRGGVARMIGGGIVAGFLLYFLTDLVFALGLSARIPVALAAWAPATVSSLLGLAMLLHMEDG